MALAVSALLAACASTSVPPTSESQAATPVAAASSPAAAASAAVPAASAALATASRPVAAASQPRTTASAAVATASAPAGAASRPASPPPDPSAPKPFAEITKDAKEAKGFVSVWTRDEKTWLEIPQNLIGKPVLLSVNFSNSVGERGLYASQMGGDWMVEFRRVGNTVQMIALNQAFRSPNDAAMATTVQQSFSNSMLAAGPLASAPHPERKSLLIDANLFLADIPNYGFKVGLAFRTGHALDRTNSHLVKVNTEKDMTVIHTNMHFSGSLPLPPVAVPGAPPSPAATPTPPRATPDPRSFFVGYVYSLKPLPAKPMATRLADPRIGHFATAYTDLGNDASPSNRVFLLERWRLEKKDPKAAMSEPVQPITYWLDKNIPTRYRKSVMDGILEWNKAFEAIGFKNAIVAKQQPDNATWDNMDGKHASIRWFTGADVGFAIGPSSADPRTGEILDADIGMSDVFSRGARRFIADDAGVGKYAAMTSEQRLAHFMAARGTTSTLADHSQHRHVRGECVMATGAAQEMQFALDILEGRGDLDPNGPEAEEFVQGVIKWVIMHEVGHTLGFKHNFKASTTVKASDLRKTGMVSGSVMDYPPYNMPLEGEAKGDFNQTTLGAYDYWAVAYAYSQFPAETEKAELAKIAARSIEPELAFADDGEAMMGIDPLANVWDLGDDPLAFYARRLKLSQELWGRLNTRKPQIGDDPRRTRRSLNSSLAQLFGAASGVSKFVGGIHTVRDLPGTTNRPAYRPVDPDQQRRALRFVTNTLFKTESFKFSPQLLTNLGADYNEWFRDGPLAASQQVVAIQSAAMAMMLSPRTIVALTELPYYVEPAKRKGIISVNEVLATVQDAIWQELSTGAETDRIRRGLQRDHLKLIAMTLTRGNWPGDAQALLRLHAQTLQGQLQRAAARGKGSIEHQAHLKDCLNTLTEALKATMSKTS